ncbi:RND transporter [Ferrimonas sediminicola]|uniref:RND transporter n=1 Tax=Ferrimonas sediminicola TaxID=2569538 RepID=A0A4V5NVI5_9GAMM|nr:MMPL family transporter [Ferrimonas sediminicola]TKB49819.1 RND transporter [Ferrimonas sediminicola]
MKERLIQFATCYPRRIYALVLALTLAATAMMPMIQIDTDPENMLPEEDAARVFHNATKAEFALYDSIVVGAVAPAPGGIFTPSSLSQMKRITDAILAIDGVVKADLMALSTVDNITQEGPGTIRFEYMMQVAPDDQPGADAIAEAVARLPLLNNTLVSADQQAAAIYVPLKDKRQSFEVAERIRTIIQQETPDAQYHITGLPVAENQFGHEMFIQMGISAPLAGLMIFLVMLYFFRSLPLVVAPMLVAMATVIIVVGSLIGMGFTVHIMSSMIAIFLMPIAVVDSIHIMSEFADHYRPGKQAREVIEKVVRDLFTPMLFTSVTSAVGFYSLMITPIPPVQIFGAFVGSGILLAFLLTITLLPAYIVRISPHSLEKMQQKLHAPKGPGLLSRVLERTGTRSVSLAKPIVAVSLGILALSVWGITKIQINDNPVRWFKSDHEIRIADRALNHHFAGTYDAYLVLTTDKPIPMADEQFQLLVDILGNEQLALAERARQGDAEALSQVLLALEDASFDSDDARIDPLMTRLEQRDQAQRRFLDPALLSWMAELQSYLDSTGLVGKSNGLPDIVKTVNRELRSGEDRDLALPDSAAGVAQTLLQYQSSHRPNDLWHFVTPDYRKGLLWLQLTSGDNQHMSQVIDAVDHYLLQHPAPKDVRLNWAGKAYINVAWQDAMVSGMRDSLLSAFLIVLGMMVLLFRSPLYGLLAMLPLTLTISFIYGLIGWIGKDYDMPIAVLSALTLGLSVDFAIHFLERFREQLKLEGEVRRALTAMFQEPARAISRNAIVIAIGFTPLLLAPLVPYITVGVLLASIMAISAVTTLLLLPSCLWLLAPLLQRNPAVAAQH